MWIIVLVLVLLGAQLNLTAIVPLQPGDPQPPWFVGGRLLWPFAVETRTLLRGDLLNTLTPLLGVTSAILFLMAAAALLHWWVPTQWFGWLVVAGALLSIPLQVVWFSGWAILPLLVDIALLWAIFGQRLSIEGLRG